MPIQPAQAQAAQPEPDQLHQSAANVVLEQNLIARLTGASPDPDKLEADLASALAPAPENPAAVAVEPKEQQPLEVVPPTETKTEEPPETVPTEEQPPATEEPKDRIRIGSYSEEDQALVNAAHILSKSGKMSFSEAFKRVSGLVSPQAEAEPEPEPPAIPQDITDLESEIAGLDEKLDKLADEQDEGVFRKEIIILQRQLSAKQTQLALRKYAHEQNNTSTIKSEVDDAVFMQERQKIEAKVPQEFPDMKVKSSLLFRQAVALGKEIASDPNHPLHRRMLDVDAPYALAEEAARSLEAAGVKVARSSKSVAPSTPQAPRVASSPNSVPSKPGPAPGSKTTAPTPTVTAQDLVAEARANFERVRSGGGKVLTGANGMPILIQ